MTEIETEIERKKNREEYEKYKRDQRIFLIAKKEYLRKEYQLLHKRDVLIEEKVGSGTTKQGSKILVWVKNKEDANLLKKEIAAEIKNVESQVPNRKEFKIKRKIKTFKTKEVKYIIRSAYMTELNQSYNNFKNTISSQLDNESIDAELYVLQPDGTYKYVPKDSKRVIKILENYRNIKKFTCRSCSGKRYEIAYYDFDKKKTITQCIGHICIVISEEKPNVIFRELEDDKRKKRNDARTPEILVLTPFKRCEWYIIKENQL